MALLDLPNEMLLHIVGFLPSETLPNFMRASREIYEVSVPHMYNRLCIIVLKDEVVWPAHHANERCDAHGADSQSFSHVYRLTSLIETLATRQDLRSYVSRAALEWNTKEASVIETYQLLCGFHHLSLPNLRSVLLKACHKHVLHPQPYPANAFALSGVNVVPPKPQVQRLEFHGIPNWREDIDYITSSMPNLKSLIIHTSAELSMNCDQNQTDLSIRLVKGYQALKDTLQELIIVDHEYCASCEGMNHPNFPLLTGLEDFKQLRRLGLRWDWMAYAHWMSDGEDSLVDGFHIPFPVNLQTLEVQIIGPTWQMLEAKTLDDGFKDALQALKDVLKYKDSDFPRLTSIKIWTSGPRPLREFEMITKEISKASSLFEQAGVKLEVE